MRSPFQLLDRGMETASFFENISGKTNIDEGRTFFGRLVDDEKVRVGTAALINATNYTAQQEKYEEIKQQGIPIAAFVGEYDIVVPPEEVKNSLGPDVELKIFPEKTHALPYSDPEITAKSLVNFLWKKGLIPPIYPRSNLRDP